MLAHVRSRPGRAWAAIRQSESAALAAGINTTVYKMWAFALASFITGVAGALLAGANQFLYSISFQTQDSITILAVVLMGGIFSLWGAIIAGLLMQLLPALLNSWGVSSDWLLILFGVGVLQVLTTAPARTHRPGAEGHPPARTAHSKTRWRWPSAARRARRELVIEVSDLTVRFGGVTPLDAMTVTFEKGTCGLIGPNGAGKTTFFNVLSGFVKPGLGQRDRVR